MKRAFMFPRTSGAGIHASALCFLAPLFCGPAHAAGAAAAYAADASSSRLEFTGTQAGAPFKAVFRKFTAAVDFSPDALANAHFDVLIDLSSVDSMDKDRDKSLRGADFFDVAHAASAHYVSHGAAARTGAGYSIGGTLTLRGVAKEVPIEFTFVPRAAGGILAGSARLKRLDFGVGQGEWKSTEWVGDEVAVAFSLTLNPAPSR